MGALARRSGESGVLNAGDRPSQAQGLMGLLLPMLDSNRDGSVVDDVLGLFGRFMTGGR
jgi:hypothetical protein